jgi:uncharacterized protein (TIGR02117 family)
VAAQIPHPLKRWRVWLAGAACAPLLLLAAFLLAAWIGSSLPRNTDWSEPADGITIMVETNGIHTGIVMPVSSRVKDWRETFPTAGLPRADGQYPTHIAIGWGEKEVFLKTPTWNDLSISTALRIVFRGGDGLLRVAHYVRPAPSPYHRPIRLSEAEYARLVARIEEALPPAPAGTARSVYTSYEPNAVHYDATGHYTLGNTCNQWVGDTLAFAGIEMGRWTPLAGGVMKWIPEPLR